MPVVDIIYIAFVLLNSTTLIQQVDCIRHLKLVTAFPLHLYVLGDIFILCLLKGRLNCFPIDQL